MPQERLAGACAFCRSPLVDSARPGEIPDLVAPFVLTREQAAERLKRHLQGKSWAPGEVRRLAPERLDGVLTPFFVHDAVARSSYVADVGEWYYVTVGSGKNRRRERRTEWFALQGSHVSERTGHLVSGSKGLPESEANELEPFDLGRLAPFEPSRVAGWIAEWPTVTREEALATARAELQRAENESIRRFLPGDEVRNVRNTTELSGLAVRTALLPAWIATFRHRGGTLRLLVNGQTGEVVGKVPVSRAKVAVAILVPLALIAIAVVIALVMQ